MEQEIWKDVRDFEGLYKISNLGEIYSSISKKKLTPFKTGDNYRAVKLWKSGVKKTVLIHTVVGNHFVDNPLSLPEINHKNFDRTDNRAVNLEWMSHGDNIRYSYEMGNRTGARGEDSPRAKHTNESVTRIRQMYSEGGYTQQELADMFNDKRNNISKIINLTRWKHI